MSVSWNTRLASRIGSRFFDEGMKRGYDMPCLVYRVRYTLPPSSDISIDSTSPCLLMPYTIAVGPTLLEVLSIFLPSPAIPSPRLVAFVALRLCRTARGALLPLFQA